MRYGNGGLRRRPKVSNAGKNGSASAGSGDCGGSGNESVEAKSRPSSPRCIALNPYRMIACGYQDVFDGDSSVHSGVHSRAW